MARTWSPARVRIRPRTSVTVTTPSRSCTPPTRSFRWLVITACLPYFLDKMGLRCHSARGPTPHLHHVHIRHPLSYHTPRRRDSPYTQTNFHSSCRLSRAKILPERADCVI